jgi:hypothetical protein
MLKILYHFLSDQLLPAECDQTTTQTTKRCELEVLIVRCNALYLALKVIKTITMRSENNVVIKILTPTRTLLQAIPKRSSLIGTPCVFSRRRSLILLLKRNYSSEMSILRKYLDGTVLLGRARMANSANTCYLPMSTSIYRASDRRYRYIPSLPSIFYSSPNTQKIVHMFETSFSLNNEPPQNTGEETTGKEKAPYFTITLQPARHQTSRNLSVFCAGISCLTQAPTLATACITSPKCNWKKP